MPIRKKCLRLYYFNNFNSLPIFFQWKNGSCKGLQYLSLRYKLSKLERGGFQVLNMERVWPFTLNKELLLELLKSICIYFMLKNEKKSTARCVFPYSAEKISFIYSGLLVSSSCFSENVIVL